MAAMQFSTQLKYHTLEAVEIIEQDHYSQPGRPGKQTRPTHKTYHGKNSDDNLGNCNRFIRDTHTLRLRGITGFWLSD